MAAVSMESRQSETQPLANVTSDRGDKGKLQPNSSKAKSFSEEDKKVKSSAKQFKRGKLSKALTLPADVSNEIEEPCPRPLGFQILPRTSQYEKHPLLQERTASGLSELEQFLLEQEKSSSEQAPTSNQVGNQVVGGTEISTSTSTKLKLQPRGAHYERHALLVKTSSGKSELEQLLLEKEKELEKKEKKLQKSKATKISIPEVPPLKRLWIKKGVSVEKARSFEKTACLEKAKSVDISQSVPRARSLEQESNLEKIRLSKLQKQNKIMDNSEQKLPVGTCMNPAVSNPESCMSSEKMPSHDEMRMTNDVDTSEGGSNMAVPESGDDGNEEPPQETEETLLINTKKQRLLDLALKPNLEWREDDQQFVVVLQSPVSPLKEKPDNLLICYEPRTNDVGCDDASFDNEHNAVFYGEGGAVKLKPLPPYEKPKKSFHPSVIDSDPDSEGMVCMDELESIDFGASSPEPSPQKDPEKAEEKELTENQPLLTENQPERSTEKEQVNASEKNFFEEIKAVPVDIVDDIERKRKLSLKRASLGQFEPRVEQYVQHPLLEEKDEEGTSAIEKLFMEKEREFAELEAIAAAKKESGELAVDSEQKHQPKASIKRVHFEKSDGGAEIEELGKVDIEADPASTNSTRSNGSKKKGFRGSKNTKSKDEAPEEEKLLDEEGDENEKDNSKTEEKKKCCCIS